MSSDIFLHLLSIVGIQQIPEQHKTLLRRHASQQRLIAEKSVKLAYHRAIYGVKGKKAGVKARIDA
jgi:hypothetical protein